jgi:hypothetical protein
MKYFVPSLFVFLLFAAEPFARPQGAGDACQAAGEKVASLTRDYKDLRVRRARLRPGVYDKDLRDHGGKLHDVLSSLGAALGHPPYTKRDIVRCLGKPDAVRNGRQMGIFLNLYKQELSKAGRRIEEKGKREYLVYFWRGWHDFLFFISEDGLVVDHGWWFAYE